jgi:hypothetical protein
LARSCTIIINKVVNTTVKCITCKNTGDHCVFCNSQNQYKTRMKAWGLDRKLNSYCHMLQTAQEVCLARTVCKNERPHNKGNTRHRPSIWGL